jgi:catalase
MVDLFNHVDHDLAKQAAMGIGVKAPSTSEAPDISKSSPAVSMDKTVKNTVKSRRVAILATDGFNHDELMAVKSALEEAGASCKIVSMYRGMLKGHNGKKVEVDKSYVATASVMFDALYVPGGKQSIDALKTHGEALHFVNETFKHCKAIAASSEGVELFAASSIQGVSLAEKASAGNIVSNKGVVTVGSKADLQQFAKSFIEAIAMHRHWDREEKMHVPA